MKSAAKQLKKFREAILDIENKLQLNNFPRAFAIVNGPCKLCTECTVLKGKPCRYPNKLRPSVAGIGTLRKFKRNCDVTMKGIRFPSVALILLE